TLPTGHSAFGRTAVSGRSLRPSPAASTTAAIPAAGSRMAKVTTVFGTLWRPFGPRTAASRALCRRRGSSVVLGMVFHRADAVMREQAGGRGGQARQVVKRIPGRLVYLGLVDRDPGVRGRHRHLEHHVDPATGAVYHCVGYAGVQLPA